MNDADNFFKQRLASFNNSKFKFDVDGPAAAGARKELKRTILLNQNMRPKNISRKEADVLRNKLKTELRSSDVALCMAALKLVRCTKPGFNQDNFDDLGAYTGITKILKMQETGSIPPAQGHIKESNDT